MKLVFTERSWDNYLWFQKNEKKVLKRINKLIENTKRTPFDGLDLLACNEYQPQKKEREAMPLALFGF